MRFTKMEGLGNDYVYLDCTKEAPDGLPELARRLSDRHFGVGSDGLICIFPSEAADFRMVMFNADGSQAEMCGNGIRCVGKYVYDKGLTHRQELKIETLAGVKTLSLSIIDGVVDTVTVDMGVPVIGEELTLEAGDRTFGGLCVSMGNPHFVCRVNGVKGFPITEYGPILEAASPFPDRTNVEFAELADRRHIIMRVWERGSGETLACGTGACATAVACALWGATDREVTVSLLGGDLHIRWSEADGHIYMTGPARTVFEGDWSDTTPL